MLGIRYIQNRIEQIHLVKSLQNFCGAFGIKELNKCSILVAHQNNFIDLTYLRENLSDKFGIVKLQGKILNI